MGSGVERAVPGQAMSEIEWTHFVIGESGGEFFVRATCTNESDASDAASMCAPEFEGIYVAEVVAGGDP